MRLRKRYRVKLERRFNGDNLVHRYETLFDDEEDLATFLQHYDRTLYTIKSVSSVRPLRTERGYTLVADWSNFIIQDSSLEFGRK